MSALAEAASSSCVSFHFASCITFYWREKWGWWVFKDVLRLQSVLVFWLSYCSMVPLLFSVAWHLKEPCWIFSMTVFKSPYSSDVKTRVETKVWCPYILHSPLRRQKLSLVLFTSPLWDTASNEIPPTNTFWSALMPKARYYILWVTQTWTRFVPALGGGRRTNCYSPR